MIRKSIVWILPVFLSLVTTISRGDIPEHYALLSSGHHLHIADSLYHEKNYSEAFDSYLKAMKNSPIPLNGAPSFKMAYSSYKTGRFKEASRLFSNLYRNQKYLPEYSSYFHIKSLWPIDTEKAIRHAIDFTITHNTHFLADSLLLPLAEALYEKHSYHLARDYYLRAIQKNLHKVRTAEYKIRAAHCLYRSGKRSLAKDEYYQIIKKYEGKPETLKLVNWLKAQEPEYSKQHFFSIAEVYYANREYTALSAMLEDYVKKERSAANREKARYYLIRLYYARGQYRTALYGFKNLLNELSNKNLEPRIRLYFARIYNRIGQNRNAIEAYVDYADRFPRRRIAPEAVWKAAWISEELRDSEGALKLYREVRTRWPRSAFAKEAFFREGFTLYRLERYDQADQVFNDIRFRRWPDKHKYRAQYWASLCRDKKGDTVAAKRLRLDLAENLWDNYYTMKSYLMHKSHIDSSWAIIKTFRENSNFLACHSNGFANLLPYFDEVYQVYDLLGENYAFGSLENVKMMASSIEEWISLGEIYKQFRAYNKAFRVYDHINRRFFRSIPYTEKTFMLKERFPFYHDDIVEKYATRYSLEKEFIFAIIKQESAFDSRAHSWANAFGLMQLIEVTAQDMARLARVSFDNTDQLFIPEYNIHLGSLYVKQLRRQFGAKEYILAAYNAGPHRVKRWRKIPGSEMVDVFIENIEFRETRDYVRKVMKNYWAYRLLNTNFQLDTNQILLGYQSGNNLPE